MYIFVSIIFFFFFFSSRRRHTRSLCDWSSDVCSSDLAQQRAIDYLGKMQASTMPARLEFRTANSLVLNTRRHPMEQMFEKRSEERRVGKECRSRWSRYH